MNHVLSHIFSDELKSKAWGIADDVYFSLIITRDLTDQRWISNMKLPGFCVLIVEITCRNRFFGISSSFLDLLFDLLIIYTLESCYICSSVCLSVCLKSHFQVCSPCVFSSNLQLLDSKDWNKLNTYSGNTFVVVAAFMCGSEDLILSGLCCLSTNVSG